MALVLGMKINEKRGGHYKYTNEIMYLHRRTCHLCGGKDADSIDHLIPFSRGGSNHPDNLMPAHRSCNSSKGARYVSDGGLMTTDEGRHERGMMTEEEEREYKEEQERIRLAARRKDIPYGELRYTDPVMRKPINWEFFGWTGINLALTIAWIFSSGYGEVAFIGLAIEVFILFRVERPTPKETKASTRNRAMDDIHNLTMLNQWAQREHNCTFEEYLRKKNTTPEEWVQKVRRTRDQHGTWTYEPIRTSPSRTRYRRRYRARYRRGRRW